MPDSLDSNRNKFNNFQGLITNVPSMVSHKLPHETYSCVLKSVFPFPPSPYYLSGPTKKVILIFHLDAPSLKTDHKGQENFPIKLPQSLPSN